MLRIIERANNHYNTWVIDPELNPQMANNIHVSFADFVAIVMTQDSITFKYKHPEHGMMLVAIHTENVTCIQWEIEE